MSTAPRRWARASSSTRIGGAAGAALGILIGGGVIAFAASAAAAAAAAAGADPLGAAERELARAGGLYLVVTAEPPALEVKGRGLTLERLPLRGVAVLLRREARGAGTPPVALPAVWRVSAEGAVDAPRRVIAPAELVPPPEEGAETAAAAAAAEEERPPEPPSEYRVGLDGGWQLWVGGGPPSTGPLARAAAAVAGGWRRLRRIAPEPPPGAIALAADADTARRLHHLFRAGLPVLVAGPATFAPSASPRSPGRGGASGRREVR